jgi:hypothetical protein
MKILFEETSEIMAKDKQKINGRRILRNEYLA